MSKMKYIKTPAGITEKIYDEKETRRRLLVTAERLGCKQDILAIMQKYDRALARCTSENERQHIAAMGAAEIYNYLGCKGGLSVNFNQIIPAKE